MSPPLSHVPTAAALPTNVSPGDTGHDNAHDTVHALVNAVPTQLNGAVDQLNALALIDFTGTGSPEGVITAPKGSTFQRTDGGSGTTFYVKETGSGNTGWVAVSSAVTLSNVAPPVVTVGTATSAAGAAATAMRSDATMGITLTVADKVGVLTTSGDLTGLTFPFVLPMDLAEFNFTLTHVRAMVKGGTSANVNLSKGTWGTPANKALITDATIAAGNWTDVGSLTGTTTYTAGDPVFGILTSVVGAVTGVMIQYAGTVP